MTESWEYGDAARWSPKSGWGRGPKAMWEEIAEHAESVSADDDPSPRT